METPVAPIGWPFAFNPPEGLIGSLPSFCVQPSLMARAPCPFGVKPIASYSISSATVKQSWVSTKDRSDSCTPADCNARCHATVQPSNCKMSRFDIGRKSRSEEHTSELQSQSKIVCRLLLDKKHTNCPILTLT